MGMALSGLGRGWWEAVLWGTGAPGRENTVGGPCCFACPVRNGLVPAEIVSVSLLSPVKIKPQHLTFTISGKGHKPQVTVVCPSARSKRGNAVLRFKRLQLGDSEMLPLVVRNNGIIPVKVRTGSRNGLVWEQVLVAWGKGPKKHGRPGKRRQKFFLSK